MLRPPAESCMFYRRTDAIQPAPSKAPAELSPPSAPGVNEVVLAPGALSVLSLAQIDRILDPSIHYLRISRPNWIKNTGLNLFATLSHEIGLLKSDLHRVETTWKGKDYVHGVPDWVQSLFRGRENFRLAWQAILTDVALVRRALIDASDAQNPNSTVRLELRDCSPGMHYDVQALNCAVAYFGGGTIAQLSDGSTVQLRPGEIGIWKGRVGGEDLLNRGQAVLHGASDNPKDYPRWVAVHDICDETLSDKVLRSLEPWSVQEEEAFERLDSPEDR